MPRWQICYTDDDVDDIECDGIQPTEDGALVFVREFRVQSVDLNAQAPPNMANATPVAFVNLMNPNIRCIRLFEGSES